MPGSPQGNDPDRVAAAGEDDSGKHVVDAARGPPALLAGDRGRLAPDVEATEQGADVEELEAVLLEVREALGFVPLEDHPRGGFL